MPLNILQFNTKTPLNEARKMKVDSTFLTVSYFIAGALGWTVFC